MERHDRAGGVAGQGEDNARGVRAVAVAGGGGFEGDGGEGGWFAGLHGDAAEVDCAAEGALDRGFEEVEFAHGDAACGDDYGDGAEGRADGGFEGAGAREAEREGRVST